MTVQEMDGPLPLKAVCDRNGCDNEHIPATECLTGTALRETIVPLGWRWDDWAGANILTCPKHEGTTA